MTQFLLVALGGAVGAMFRHAVNLAALRLFGAGFPWGTLAVNVAGCLAMGAFIEILARRAGAAEPLRLVIAVGLLGGFTTFSAFALDAVNLWGRGNSLACGFYIAANTGLSVAALIAGLALGRAAS